MLLISIDAKAGVLRRYECDGGWPRATHVWRSFTAPVSFKPENILEFYCEPSDIDKVGNEAPLPSGAMLRQTAFTPAFDHKPEPDLTPCA